MLGKVKGGGPLNGLAIWAYLIFKNCLFDPLKVCNFSLSDLCPKVKSITPLHQNNGSINRINLGNQFCETHWIYKLTHLDLIQVTTITSILTHQKNRVLCGWDLAFNMLCKCYYTHTTFIEMLYPERDKLEKVCTIYKD